MPKMLGIVTEWNRVYSIESRVKEGCHLWKDGKCRHPMFALGSPKGGCALEVEGAECPLEKHPVMLCRKPDHLHEAEQEAIRAKAIEEMRRFEGGGTAS